jgi:hypothetical protein
MQMMSKYLVLLRKQLFIKNNSLMLYREIIAAFCENSTEHINTFVSYVGVGIA